MLQGHPISAKLTDEPGFGERFWYWRGHSGRTYIHSIYASETCPPLPGAVYVVVRRIDGVRSAIAAGRFPTLIEGKSLDVTSLVRGLLPTDEIHVHLLARDNETARHVLWDIETAMYVDTALEADVPGLAEPCQLELIAA